MLILNDKKFIKTPFSSEAELEQVVIDNFEFLFGPSSIYLPKAKIVTSGGFGTVPDGFAIDIEAKKWYLVEAELIHHSLWSHIVPQITKQILAASEKLARKKIIELSVDQYRSNSATKEKFDELGIAEIHVHRYLEDILENEPIIGIPIDGITEDLKAWARTLKYNVKLWLVNKFVEFNNPSNIIFELPEEYKPELDTEQELTQNVKSAGINRYDVQIADLISNGIIKAGDWLYMNYKPRNRAPKTYKAFILEDGSLQVDDQVFGSPSYAALYGIQDSGSSRQTVNGWTSWKTGDGRSLADLREGYIQFELVHP